MNKNKEKFDIYQMVTDQIIEILETHEKLNFTYSWTPSTGEILASNPVSKTIYRGFNQIYLCYVAQKNKYGQNRWLTVRQGNNLGARIKKGEKGRPITYWGRLYKDEKTGRNITAKIAKILAGGGEMQEGVKTTLLLRYYNVFNIEQFTDLPEKLFFKGETIQYTEPEKDELAEEFVTKTGARIAYVQDGGNCYYPIQDFIQLCDREQFKGKEAFYRTAFHELGHWTGHASRLNRPMKNRFGTPEYAEEELTAELFSAFTAARCGFTQQITNNAAYIKSWLSCLRGDKKFIFRASSQAQKAADFVGDLVGIKIGETVEFSDIEEPGEL